MLTFLKGWAKRVLGKWYLLPIYLFYKLAEDRLLQWGNSILDNKRGDIVEVIRVALDYIPFITWAGIPITIVVLLILAWRNTRVGQTPVPSQQIITIPGPAGPPGPMGPPGFSRKSNAAIEDIIAVPLNSNEQLPVVYIRSDSIDWGNAAPTVGAEYIDFHWLIYNGWLPVLEIQEEPSGRVRFRYVEGATYGRIQESLELVSRVRIPKDHEESLTLRQHLPAYLSNIHYSPREDKKIAFDFSHVRLKVKGIASDGSEYGSWEISLPAEWKDIMPIFVTLG